MKKHWPSLVLGLLAGVAVMLACGDDAPPADAADVCDCPPAEPPIAGRITVIKNEITLPPMDSTGASNTCPAGSTLLSGSCRLPTADPNATLGSSGFSDTNPNTWACDWTNTGNTEVPAQVFLKCLAP